MNEKFEEKGKNFLIQFKKGNLAAFEKILFVYEKAIFNHIYRLTENREDAEDLTQETFIKLYLKRRYVNLEKNFKSWLYKIATNTTKDFWRRKRNVELFIIDDSEKPFETIDEKNAYYHIENALNLEIALNKIKPAYKAVLLLFYKDGLEYKEISEVLEIPINTVKTQIHRAKKSLKEQLSK